MMTMPRRFEEPHRAALALLANGCATDRKTANFLGWVAADLGPLSPKQTTWLDDVLKKNGSALM
jgi:hypothetical protein